MNRRYLLPENGSFYKANLHCHSTVSDGALTPAQLKELYQSRGYSIVAFTDHRIYRYHKELSDDSFLAMAGFEADINQARVATREWTCEKTWHLNFIDTDPERDPNMKRWISMPDQRYEDKAYINQYVKELRELGFLASYNHPAWSMQTWEDYHDLEGFFSMEIYNHGCAVEGFHSYSPHVYDEMLRSGQRLCCLATDDNHNHSPKDSPRFDSFGGFVMIKAPSLTYPAVAEALLNRHFYYSMGPEIKALFLDGNTVTIHTSPVKKIFMNSGIRMAGSLLADEGETITSASFTLSENIGYFRIDCMDGSGRYAGTNAYFMDELF